MEEDFAATFPFVAQKPHALVFACMDYRSREAIQAFVKNDLDIESFDLKTDAGSIKQINVGEYSVRKWILQNFKLAIERHGIKEILMFVHSDCSAYGGSTKLGDYDTELRYLVDEMQKALRTVRTECFSVKVTGYIAVLKDDEISMLPVEV